MNRVPSGYDFLQPLLDRKHLLRIGAADEAGAMNEGLDLIRRRRDQKICVVKYISTRLSRHKHGKPSAQEETDILIQVRGHPHIVYLIQAHFYMRLHSAALITEYCDLGSLEGLKRRSIDRDGRQLPEAFIWHMLKSMAKALAFLHYGTNELDKASAPNDKWDFIMHRDIKPSNIFLKSNNNLQNSYPRIILGDFGIATTCSTLRHRQPLMRNASARTPTYEPPEFPCYERKSDVWALAAVAQDLLGVVRFDPWTSQPLLNPDLGRVMSSTELLKCVCAARVPDPKRRISSLDLVTELRRSQTIAVSRRSSHVAFRPLQPWHFFDDSQHG